jgi:hypothetical protein
MVRNAHAVYRMWLPSCQLELPEALLAGFVELKIEVRHVLSILYEEFASWKMHLAVPCVYALFCNRN